MTSSRRTGQPLGRALSLLLPDVFFHPVWTHFVEAETPLAPQRIQSLLDAADAMLSAGNPGDACRILFICVFQQLRICDYVAASSNIQRILVLAEQNGLPQVAWWATWGAAAVFTRRGWFQQAAEHLEHLQFMLSQQHEWVLSDVIDVIRQALPSQVDVTAAHQLLSSDVVLSSALGQLLQWGIPCAASRINTDDLVGGNHFGRWATAPSGSTRFTWRSLWQTIKRVVKGELRLKWVETNSSAPLPRPEEPNAWMLTSPVVVTALAPAPMPSSLNRPATSAQDREPAAESPAPPSIMGHSPLPAVIEEPEASIVSTHYAELTAITPFSTEAQEEELKPPLPTLIGEPETPAVSVLPSTAGRAPESYTMAIYCFGPFRVYQHHQLIEEWTGLRGQAVLKYLVAQRGTPIPKDVLMDAFWLDADPEAARRNLHQAIYSLRQTLRRRDPDFQHIQFENNQYLLNPALSIWIDVEEFETHFQSGRRLEAAGQLAAAMVDYGAAEALYQGDFLEEDLYDDWPRPQREQLRTTYLNIADRLSEYYRQQGEYSAAIALCQKILALDNCVEESHRRLMRCYLAQGHRHMAIRQYHICVQALAKELDVPPAVETRSLYASISANW